MADDLRQKLVPAVQNATTILRRLSAWDKKMTGTRQLTGTVVLVTGRGDGIGHAIALAAAKAGARVVAEIEAAGGAAVANGDDVSDPDGAQAMVAQATGAFGRVDAVVYNAGILRDSYVHKMTHEDLDGVVKVHLYGTFNVSRAAAEVMRGQGSGSLIHMTSDIKVDSPEQEARVARLTEMVPEKIAPLTLHLASDDGSDITGQIFAGRNNEIFLISQSRPVRSAHDGDGWDMDRVRVCANPALRSGFLPLEVSRDVFCWDFG